MRKTRQRARKGADEAAGFVDAQTLLRDCLKRAVPVLSHYQGFFCFHSALSTAHLPRYLKILILHSFKMHYNKLALAAIAATAVNAQDRPKDEPICDFYTKALLEENTAENQATLLTLVVNTVVIGNCMLSLQLILSASRYTDTHRHRAQCRH